MSFDSHEHSKAKGETSWINVNRKSCWFSSRKCGLVHCRRPSSSFRNHKSLRGWSPINSKGRLFVIIAASNLEIKIRVGLIDLFWSMCNGLFFFPLLSSLIYRLLLRRWNFEKRIIIFKRFVQNSVIFLRRVNRL